MHDKINKISSDAVKKATGKGWDEWIKTIDQLGATKMTHKQIAQMLWDKKLIKSGWWCQMVTVGYEYAKNRRTTGETEQTGFEIGAQKTLPIKAQAAWELITSAKGREIWLGKTKDFKLQEKSPYKTNEGTKGEIRTISKGERLRLTWQPKTWEKPSTLQLYVLSKGAKTSLGFHQEKLKDKKTREQMRQHWRGVMQKLANLI